MRMHFAAIFVASVLLVGCLGGGKTNTQQGQGLILALQNQGDLDHLYLYYNGPTTDADIQSSVPNAYGNKEARDAAQAEYNRVFDSTRNNIEEANAAYYRILNAYPASSRNADSQQIGELNLVLQNVGGSATLGGLFVSGYDPKLISVESRLGQRPINKGSQKPGSCFSSSRDCFKGLDVRGTGDYELTYFCEPVDTQVGCAVDVSKNGDSTDFVGSLFNLNVGSVIDRVNGLAGQDTDFAKSSLFQNNPINVHSGFVDGKPVLKIQFSNPYSFDSNRASHGYLLINLFYPDFSGTGCPNNCRVFPDRAPQDIMSGVSDEYPQGDIRYLDYDIYIDRSAWNPLVNELKQTFQITACYLYTTTVTPTVCVDPFPQNNVNDACTTTEPILFKEGQGAPIKVSRIESKAIPGAMQYTIYVEHVGSGQVWLPGSLDQCSPYTPAKMDPRKMNAVQLIDARVSGDAQQLLCVPQSNTQKIVRLENGRGQITCIYPTKQTFGSPTSAYSTSLTLEFGYLYQNSVRKDVVIHRT